MVLDEKEGAIGQEAKSWNTALILSAALGFLGIDRFYLGKVGIGLLKLLTGGGFGIWWLIDVILIAAYNVEDSQGRPLKREGQRTRWILVSALIFVGIVGAGSGGIFFSTVQLVKSSGAYEVSTAYVSEHELVKGEIGEIKGFGFMPQGTVSVGGPSGEASLAIGVKGERESGTLYTVLVKQLGQWRIVQAEFETSSGKRLNLLMPNEEELREIARETLIAFDQAVQAEDFTSFYANTAVVWRSQTSPEALETAFQRIIDSDFSMSEVLNSESPLVSQSMVETKGILALSAQIDDLPLAYVFDLQYIYEHPQWKLVGIEMSVKAAGMTSPKNANAG